MINLLEIAAPTLEWMLLSPLLVILAAACLGVLVEALAPRELRYVIQSALAAIAVVAAHLSATDAAGHLARAHARGDDSAVHAIRQSVGPDARVEARYGDDAVTVTVTMRLAMMDVTGRATALLEDTATR